VIRTGRTPGRGGAMYSHFDVREWTDHSLTEAGPISDDLAWERITYFLSKVIPVANEYKVRMACHPHDPGMPADKGFRGALGRVTAPINIQQILTRSDTRVGPDINGFKDAALPTS